MTEESAPQADVRASRWPGWIWLLPVGVLGFLIWLAIRTWIFGGATVTVAVSSASGVSSGALVKFREVEVGTVRAVRLNDAMTDVLLELDMKPHVTSLLRDGTRFWIVQPSLASGNLQNLMSGAHVAMDPGAGEPARRFRALRRPPVEESWDPGRDFVLTTTDPGSLRRGAPVRYLGTRVGEVRGVVLSPESDEVRVLVFVRRQHAGLIREGTRFWRGGGVRVSTGGGLDVELPALTELASGAIDFHTPGILAGAPASRGAVFALHGSRATALATPAGTRLAYELRFPDPVDGLAPGTPVELGGVRVGRVARVALDYDPRQAALSTVVRIAIDAGRLGLGPEAMASRGALADATNEFLAGLLRQGVRARPSGGLIPGTRSIALERVEDAGPATLTTDDSAPELPTARGAGLADATATIGRITATVEQLPLAEIARHLRRSTARLDELIHDPGLAQALADLEAALADVERIAASAERRVPRLLESLQHTARRTEAVAHRVEALLGDSVRQNRDLAELMNELTNAARAVGELAAYLDRHPEALIMGRDG